MDPFEKYANCFAVSLLFDRPRARAVSITIVWVDFYTNVYPLLPLPNWLLPPFQEMVIRNGLPSRNETKKEVKPIGVESGRKG